MSPRTRAERRRGQVVVLAPIAVLALGGFMALTVDVGQIAVWRARLQGAADATALAGMSVLVSQQIEGTVEDAAREAAIAEANRIHGENAPTAGLEIEFGSYNDEGNFAATESNSQATAIRVTAYRNADAPGGRLGLIFAPLMGLEQCDVRAASVCDVTSNITGVLAGLAPFAVPEDRIPDIGESLVFYPADGESYDDGLGDVTVASGCWGLLNLDGGDLSTSEIVDWIEDGYDGVVRIDPKVGYLWIPGTSGFRAALNQPMRAKMGDSMIMAIYDEVVGNGSNADFRCVGFMKGTITYAKLVGNDPKIICTLDQVDTLHNLTTGGTKPSPNISKVRLVE